MTTRRAFLQSAALAAPAFDERRQRQSFEEGKRIFRPELAEYPHRNGVYRRRKRVSYVRQPRIHARVVLWPHRVSVVRLRERYRHVVEYRRPRYYIAVYSGRVNAYRLYDRSRRAREPRCVIERPVGDLFASGADYGEQGAAFRVDDHRRRFGRSEDARRREVLFVFVRFFKRGLYFSVFRSVDLQPAGIYDARRRLFVTAVFFAKIAHDFVDDRFFVPRKAARFRCSLRDVQRQQKRRPPPRIRLLIFCRVRASY